MTKPIATIIRQVYRDYLEYLANGGDRIRIPEHKHVDPETPVVYSSSLMRCPLLAAKKRNKDPEVLPQSPAKRLAALHIMQQGTRSAEPIQEAMLWHSLSGDEPKMKVDVELSLSSLAGKLRGRVDLVITIDNHIHLIEIKQKSDNYQTPRMPDIFQALSYSYMWKPEDITAHVMTVRRVSAKDHDGAFNLWTLKPDEHGFIVVGEDGGMWNHPVNNPEFINYTTMWVEIERHRKYLAGELNGPPIVDFINTEGFWCASWVGNKPKKYKKLYKGKEERQEYMHPTCTHFCHFATDELGEEGFLVRETAYQSGEYEPVDIIPDIF